MNSRFNVGDLVVVKKKIKNDGTFPGVPWGELLVNIGEKGVIIDIGKFLITTDVYTVYFPDRGIIVGCLEHELELCHEKECSV